MGDNGKANKYGKVLSFTIALISTLSLYYIGKETSMQDVILKILPIYGVFAGAMLAILFFMIIYFGFRSKEGGRWELAVLGSGFMMAVVGYFITRPTIQSIGWIIGIVGLILYISSTGLLQDTIKENKQ